MNCTQVQDLLSNYFDGELSFGPRQAVAKHLRSCSRCAADLAAVRRLSTMAKLLSPPQLSDSWDALESLLDFQRSVHSPAVPVVTLAAPVSTAPHAAKHRMFARRDTRLRRAHGWLGLATLVLLGMGIGSLAIHEVHRRHERQMAANFGKYLEAFEENPEHAHQILLASYPARQVDANEPGRELRQPPAVSKLPPGYRLQTTYLVDMPCCQCVHALCRRADGSLLTVIEHDASQAVSFGSRPCQNIQCNGRETCFAQLGDHLAATWKAGGRFISVIGARDADEVSLLMSHLLDRPT